MNTGSPNQIKLKRKNKKGKTSNLFIFLIQDKEKDLYNTSGQKHRKIDQNIFAYMIPLDGILCTFNA